MTPHRRRRPRRRAGQPRDHPRPATPPPTTSSRSASKLGLHGTNYVVGWTAWLDLAPVGVSKASGLQHVADALGLGRRRRARDRRRPQRPRDARWARRGVAMGQAVEEVLDGRRRVTGSVYEDGVAVELDRWFGASARPPRDEPPPMVTTRAAAAAAVDRRRDAPTSWPGGTGAHWHPDYPRQDDRDAATLWRDGDPWGPRHIVRGATALGSIGFFGPPGAARRPPDDAPGGRGRLRPGRGGARAGASRPRRCAALLAETDRARRPGPGQRRPDNRASIRVLAKCGFTELRGADEDGDLVMARPLPRRPWLSCRVEVPVRREPRLVATDLDGTLVRSDGTRLGLHPRRAARARGAAACRSSSSPAGRCAGPRRSSSTSARTAWPSSPTAPWCGTSPAPGSTSSARSTRALGLEVCRLVRAAVPGTTFAVETLAGIGLEPAFLERHPVPDGSRRGRPRGALRRPGAQAAGPPRGARRRRSSGTPPRRPSRGRLVITWSSTSALLEISAPGRHQGLDAGAALRRPRDRRRGRDRLRRHAQRPADARPGRARRTRWPTRTRRVTAAADHVAPGHDDDGVARVLAGVFGL